MARPALRCARFGLFAALFATGACTFPEVQYDQPCSVPTDCHNPTETCHKQADSDRNACLASCAMTPSGDCGVCTTEFNAALAVCLENCDDCSAANGCTNATQSCKTRLGLP
jgi:hypothetical protein